MDDIKIIGLLTTTDSGKSLLQDYWRKNFKTQIFESTNISERQIPETIKKIDATRSHQVYWAGEIYNYDTIVNLIKVHGCDTLPYQQIKKQLSNEKLKEIYKNHITKKKRIFVFVRCVDYNYYCDCGFYVSRDIRARWAVTQHRNLGVDGYANILHSHFRDYSEINNKTTIMEINFEDLIANPKRWIDKVKDHASLEYDTQFIPSTAQYNKWLTVIDLKNLRAYVDDGNLLKQEELDYLSEKFSDYNEHFGYPEHMTIDDLFPPTLQEDINNFMKIWKHGSSNIL